MYTAGVVCASLFCVFYAAALSGPRQAIPWLLIAYAVFPVALILLILAERERRRGRTR